MSTLTSITDRAVEGAITHAAADTQGMIAGAALDKYDLVKLSAANTVVKATATDVPIGIVDKAYASGATDVSVLRLDGRTLKMRSSAAVAIGLPVTTAADGEFAAATIGTSHIIGVVVVASTAADQNVDIMTGV